jgi:hypothetical protein
MRQKLLDLQIFLKFDTAYQSAKQQRQLAHRSPPLKPEEERRSQPLRA